MGPSKRDMHKAAVKIQQHIRGFLVRRRFEKLRRKVQVIDIPVDRLMGLFRNK